MELEVKPLGATYGGPLGSGHSAIPPMGHLPKRVPSDQFFCTLSSIK